MVKGQGLGTQNVVIVGLYTVTRDIACVILFWKLRLRLNNVLGEMLK